MSYTQAPPHSSEWCWWLACLCMLPEPRLPSLCNAHKECGIDSHPHAFLSRSADHPQGDSHGQVGKAHPTQAGPGAVAPRRAQQSVRRLWGCECRVALRQMIALLSHKLPSAVISHDKIAHPRASGASWRQSNAPSERCARTFAACSDVLAALTLLGMLKILAMDLRCTMRVSTENAPTRVQQKYFVRRLYAVKRPRRALSVCMAEQTSAGCASPVASSEMRHLQTKGEMMLATAVLGEVACCRHQLL